MFSPVVTLLVRRRGESEADAFGETRIGAWEAPESVSGCLFAPGAPEGISTERPNGARIDATAYFPADYAKSLRGAQVSADGASWLDVIGDPAPFPSLPHAARWNLYAYLTRTEG